ncbi:MAG TPA: transcription antitermination factor NusB [Candidatus Rifleibacterium sp.]|nr:transcription antitermination factor NusB [Candidatus Rifleibacterium sp.]HPT47472.1 transcription antitermination factor NusB [Candidatus Rifleibacterium sp.]
MNSPRRRAREVALKALYQAEMVKSDNDEALNQVLSESVFYPVVEAAARDFLKSTKAKEILSGEVEAFVPDFSDSLSAFPHETPENLPLQVKSLLEKYFPGVTYNPACEEELKTFCKKLREKTSRLSQIEEFARQLMACAGENRNSIDKVLEKTAANWSLERMASIDRCILRIAACELFHFPEIPANATINEAIELAKKYSADRSYEFVNGILDRICKENKLSKSGGGSSDDTSRKNAKIIDQEEIES